MSGNVRQLSTFESFLTPFTKVRPGEGRAIFILFLHAFLLMTAYYLVRPVREALILTEADAQLRSYAAFFQALAIVVIIPGYSMLFRAHASSLLIQRVNLFFGINLLLLSAVGWFGLRFGAWFFIWVGIFSVFVVANFWAFAADLFNVKSGKRLFPLIAVGLASGAYFGSQLHKFTYVYLGPYGMMMVSGLVLLSTLMLSRAAEQSIPAESRADQEASVLQKPSGVLGGFEVVFRNRYLVLLALMMFAVNWLTATGDAILSDALKMRFRELSAAGLENDEETFISLFYSNFFANVTLVGFLVQLFVVSRLFRWFGIPGTLMIPVMLFFFGFLLIGFFPIFLVIQWVLAIHKSNDYSILNTTRSALFLPVDRAEKYEGKTTIDTFFWRFGDMAAGAATYVFRNFPVGTDDYIQFNIIVAVVLSLLLVVLALYVSADYKRLAAKNLTNAAPNLKLPIQPASVLPGSVFSLSLPEDTFVDNDPGDLLTYRAELHNGEQLPKWMKFDATSLTLSGTVPVIAGTKIEIRVTATDDEGLEVSDFWRIEIKKS